jgi:hypothetical protein
MSVVVAARGRQACSLILLFLGRRFGLFESGTEGSNPLSSSGESPANLTRSTSALNASLQSSDARPFKHGHLLHVTLEHITLEGLVLDQNSADGSRTNDRLHEAVQRHPDRFSAFAVVPTANPRAAPVPLVRNSY